MREIKAGRDKVVFEGQNGQTISFTKRNPYEFRQRYALGLGAKFLIKNSKEVLNLMGADISDELDVFKKPEFQKAVKALKEGYVPRKTFEREMTEVISSSIHHPDEIQAHLIAGNFTSYVYGEVERLGLERRTKV